MLTFGLLADIHCAERPPYRERHYRNAAAKAARCLEALSRRQVAFIAHLGDMVDWPGDAANGDAALARMQAVFSQVSTPCRYVLGNHDVDSVPRERLCALWDIPPCGYYAFAHKEARFVVLDTNRDRLGVPYAPGGVRWDESHVDTQQLEWLEREAATAENSFLIVFSHALLDDFDDTHVVRNAGEVRRILERCGKRVVVFQGHMHGGRMSRTRLIPYCTLPAVVEGAERFGCWVVTVGDNGTLSIDAVDETGTKPLPLPR